MNVGWFLVTGVWLVVEHVVPAGGPTANCAVSPHRLASPSNAAHCSLSVAVIANVWADIWADVVATFRITSGWRLLALSLQ